MKETKQRHENAIVINLSGHRLPQSIFEQLKEQGHKYFHIYSEHIHINPDDNIYSQCYDIVNNLLSKTNQNGLSLLDVEGERYYVNAGHAQANLIIYNAIAALLGYNPVLLITGINRFKFQEYECKQTFDMQSWTGRWRSIERNKYLTERLS